MTDRTDHYLAAQGALADAIEWGQQAEEPLPEAGELACLAHAAVHALLAIHDTLEKLVDAYAQAQRRDHYVLTDQLAASEERQREEELEDAWQSRDWETVRRLQDEAEQREEARYSIRDLVARSSLGSPEVEAARAEIDPEAVRRVLARVADLSEAEADEHDTERSPLDEDDHRDRMDCDGDLWGRNLGGCWHTRILRTCRIPNCEWTLAHLDEHYGPLAFAPEPPPDAARGDLTASEGENGSVEGDGADDASEALLCPDCGHDIEDHCEYCCECTRSPSGVAYALIEQAVNIKRIRMTAQLRQVISSVQDSGNLAELDALADAWEAGTDG